MDVINSESRFDQAISGLGDRLQEILMKVPRSAKASAFEVRLRTGKPIALTLSGFNWFLDHNARLHNSPQRGFEVDKQDIEKSIVKMCSYSLHSHQDEMKNGYISLQGGHRAGICGSAVMNGGVMGSVRDITSINLRIARDVREAAAPIIKKAFSGGVTSLLIVGAPSSGKTTVLRDLARQLSGGRIGSFLKTAVIDERGEIGAVYDGVPQNDLGPCCDILSGYPKAEGIMTAVRTLSPHVVLCDEIGGEAEVSGILDSVNCGVKMICTAHAANLQELPRRRQIRRLLEYGVFERIVLLGGHENPGEIMEIMEAGDLLAEDYGDGFDSPVLLRSRSFYG